MRMRYTFIKILLVLLGLGGGLILSAQQISIVDTSPSCEGQQTGSIQIELLANELEEDWLPPFDVDWQNLESGHIGNMTLDSLNGEISNLIAGGYEVQIDLSDLCVLTITASDSFLYYEQRGKAIAPIIIG